jgi:hypothetical protein
MRLASGCRAAACIFATAAEAHACVEELKSRWTSVTDTRVVACDAPVNYWWDGNRAVPKAAH